MDSNTKFLYHRFLKLGPAVGDWTTLQYRDPSLEDVHISQVQNVNFDSLPRDEMERLHYLHYRVAEQVAQRLSKDMDIKVELHSIVANQMTYGDFLKTQDKKVVQSDYVIKDNGRINVIFTWELADMIVNRLVGGQGDESTTESFTSVELTILEAQMETLLTPFLDVWKGIYKPDDLSIDFNVGNFVYDQKLSLREAYLAFTIYLYFGKGELCSFSWAYPSSMIRDMMKRRQALVSPSAPRVALNLDTKKQAMVDLKAVLGQAKLRMSELRALQPGDVIPLDRAFDQPVDLFLGKDTKFKVQPGVVDNKVCVQLVSDSQVVSTHAPQVMPTESADADAVPHVVDVVPVEEELPIENVQEPVDFDDDTLLEDGVDLVDDDYIPDVSEVDLGEAELEVEDVVDPELPEEEFVEEVVAEQILNDGLDQDQDAEEEEDSFGDFSWDDLDDEG